ncbi:hypothetical protein FUAX_55610 (plasmid) [Fulvitalea axinellae]|uniref:Uncharacterized protein n=1 Tax=Fulvitalea axinellae TaxID=1182444 RepID=A0AAU9DFA5_9BACT|nr:hypothetical protein FUAX_55610 [Fulvitalea axinellae]
MNFRDILLQSAENSPREREFNLESTIVDTVFSSNFTPIKTENIWRLAVDFFPEKRNTSFKLLGGVLLVDAYLDYDNYWSNEINERKLILIEALDSIAKKICKEYDLPYDHFKEAKERSIEQGLKYANYWGRSMKSPDNKFSAGIFMELDVNVSAIEVHFKDLKTKELIKKILVNPKPDYMFFDRYLGKSFWDEEGYFCLVSKDKKTVLKSRPE